MSIQPLEGSLGSTPLSPFAAIGDGTNPLAQDFAPGAVSGDAISRIVPPWLTNTMANPGQTAMLGPLPGLMQQLLAMLQQLMGSLGGSPYANGNSCPPYQNNCQPAENEQFFRNAAGGSDGDPHLSFNGNRWNSMVSQPDLLESNSIPGGFKLSTQVTQPNERGVTRNQSSTIALNGGATRITMDDGGKATIESYGKNLSISAGQTLQLGNGTTVTCQRDGQLDVSVQGAGGGQITTTLTAKNRGVDVDVNAHNVDLGGALVNGEALQPGPGPEPIPSPLPIPIANPFSLVDPNAANQFAPSEQPYRNDY
ncbi:MAG TPA: hypothetical protein VGF86_03500 [Candidatus Tumulicola sp.]|jgi:hypothetical protein